MWMQGKMPLLCMVAADELELGCEVTWSVCMLCRGAEPECDGLALLGIIKHFSLTALCATDGV